MHAIPVEGSIRETATEQEIAAIKRIAKDLADSRERIARSVFHILAGRL
jgi:hypothetical protein